MTRTYKDWEIETVGGHITIRRFVATKGKSQFWMFRLAKVKEAIDKLEAGEPLESLSPIYLTPLYN